MLLFCIAVSFESCLVSFPSEDHLSVNTCLFRQPTRIHSTPTIPLPCLFIVIIYYSSTYDIHIHPFLSFLQPFLTNPLSHNQNDNRQVLLSTKHLDSFDSRLCWNRVEELVDLLPCSRLTGLPTVLRQSRVLVSFALINQQLVSHLSERFQKQTRVTWIKLFISDNRISYRSTRQQKKNAVYQFVYGIQHSFSTLHIVVVAESSSPNDSLFRRDLKVSDRYSIISIMCQISLIL